MRYCDACTTSCHYIHSYLSCFDLRCFNLRRFDSLPTRFQLYKDLQTNLGIRTLRRVDASKLYQCHWSSSSKKRGYSLTMESCIIHCRILFFPHLLFHPLTQSSFFFYIILSMYWNFIFVMVQKISIFFQHPMFFLFPTSLLKFSSPLHFAIFSAIRERLSFASIFDQR